MNNFEELFIKFIGYIHVTKGTSSNTEVSYLRDLRQMQTYLIANGVKEIDQVTDKHLTAFVDSLFTAGKKSTTISRCVASMKAFFGYLFTKKIISNNPAESLKTPKIEKKEPSILSMDEVVRLIECVDKDTPKEIRDRAMLELMYATGMRVSELISMRLEDLNMPGEFVVCADSKKTRQIPFGHACKVALEKYLSGAREELLEGKASEYLFVNCSGDEMSRQGFWKIIKTYGKRAKITSELTPHTLRHSFAAHLVSGGAELKDIQEMLGHSDISTTQMYAKMSKNSVRESYKKAFPR